jgi:hypothetical protein
MGGTLRGGLCRAASAEQGASKPRNFNHGLRVLREPPHSALLAFWRLIPRLNPSMSTLVVAARFVDEALFRHDSVTAGRSVESWALAIPHRSS